MRSQGTRGAAVAATSVGLAWLALAGCGTGGVSAGAAGGTATPAPRPAAPTTVASPVVPSPTGPPTPSGTVAGPGGGGAQPSAGSSRGPCTLAQLSITLSASTSAKFEESATIVFTDTGTGPCTLAGVPGLRLGGAAGAMPITAQRQPGASGAVVLNPGQQASARLEWNKYQGQGDPCPPFPTSVSVTPPGARTARTLPWIAGTSGSVCGGTIKVYAIVAGAGGTA